MLIELVSFSILNITYHIDCGPVVNVVSQYWFYRITWLGTHFALTSVTTLTTMLCRRTYWKNKITRIKLFCFQLAPVCADYSSGTVFITFFYLSYSWNHLTARRVKSSCCIFNWSLIMRCLFVGYWAAISNERYILAGTVMNYFNRTKRCSLAMTFWFNNLMFDDNASRLAISQFLAV